MARQRHRDPECWRGTPLLVSPNHKFYLSAAAAGGMYHSSCILKPPMSDRVSMLCFLTRNGQVFATPNLVIKHGQPAAMEIADSEHDFDFQNGNYVVFKSDTRNRPMYGHFERPVGVDGAGESHDCDVSCGLIAGRRRL